MRLVDIDELIEAHYKACNEDTAKEFPVWSLELMKQAPTVDITETEICLKCQEAVCNVLNNAMARVRKAELVVRCENCIYNTRNTDGVSGDWCYKHGIDIGYDDFCSHGERTEEE